MKILKINFFLVLLFILSSQHYCSNQLSETIKELNAETPITVFDSQLNVEHLFLVKNSSLKPFHYYNILVHYLGSVI